MWFVNAIYYTMGAVALGMLLFVFWPWKHPGERNDRKKKKK